MQVLKEVGEIGVYVGQREVLLRPSLSAMARLGDPAEIVRTYAAVMQEDFQDALAVLYACSDEDVSDLFGYHVAGPEACIEYAPGLVPAEHVIALAQCLMKHGITGALEPLAQNPGDEPEYMVEFSARDHVALAVAHLGVSEREAWQMTMTGLVGALRAKFKPAAGPRPPTKQEHEATMAWYERVEAERAKQKRTH